MKKIDGVNEIDKKGCTKLSWALFNSNIDEVNRLDKNGGKVGKVPTKINDEIIIDNVQKSVIEHFNNESILNVTAHIYKIEKQGTKKVEVYGFVDYDEIFENETFYKTMWCTIEFGVNNNNYNLICLSGRSFDRILF